MMGRALSPFNGHAHMDAVIRGQAAVGPPPIPALAHPPLSLALYSGKSQEVKKNVHGRIVLKHGLLS